VLLCSSPVSAPPSLLPSCACPSSSSSPTAVLCLPAQELLCSSAAPCLPAPAVLCCCALHVLLLCVALPYFCARIPNLSTCCASISCLFPTLCLCSCWYACQILMCIHFNCYGLITVCNSCIFASARTIVG
jgi:hypothetical protein